jgi:uncharacterized protein (DUF433 family)
MSTLDEIERAVAALTPAEMAQLFQRIARELGEACPGIERRADVCGGEACIIRTRIPLWLLEQARRLGTSDADILRSYPALRADDLINAWAYARAHPDEVEEQIRANEAA